MQANLPGPVATGYGSGAPAGDRAHLSIDDDLGILCNFEIVLRNVLALKSEAGRVMATHADQERGHEIAVLDATVSAIELLVDAVADLRSVLAAEANP